MIPAAPNMANVPTELVCVPKVGWADIVLSMAVHHPAPIMALAPKVSDVKAEYMYSIPLK